MEKYLLIIKIILLSYNLCVAQENQISEPSNLSGNDHRLCIFAEIGGTGGNTLSGNIEYQLLFKNNTRGAYFRGGLGIFEWNPYDGGYFNYRPLAEAGFLIGKNSKYFDIGLGFSLWDYDSDKYWDSDSDKYHNEYYFWYSHTLRLGYRKQGEKGLTFRIAAMIMRVVQREKGQYVSYKDVGFIPWLGIGLGYAIPVSKR